MIPFGSAFPNCGEVVNYSSVNWRNASGVQPCYFSAIEGGKKGPPFLGKGILMLTENELELPAHLKMRRKTARNHNQVYQKVVVYLEEQEFSPSLKPVARFAKVSVGYLEYRFPYLVRKIVKNYRAHRKQQALVNRYRAQAAALRFFTEDGYADHTQSRKEADRVLKEESGLPKWVLKDAIQTAYGALQVGGA